MIQMSEPFHLLYLHAEEGPCYPCNLVTWCRGFLTDAEIFLNASGEEVLFNGEMRQLDNTCLHCQQ